MARLNKEDFNKAISTILGDRTDEESVSFMENMIDTFNGLETDASVTASEWEQKYNALNDSWGKRYKERFTEQFNSPNGDEHNDEKNEPKTFDDLFTIK